MIDLDSIENGNVRNALDLASNEVLKNCDLITPASLGTNILLHVSTRKLVSVPPNVSKIAAGSEDNTFLRIHCSNNLLGCLIGSGWLERNWQDKLNKKRNIKDGEYTGMIYVYTFPFEYALKPNKNLVFDADLTNELWLFTYDKNTRTFCPSTTSRLIRTKYIISPGIYEAEQHNYEMVIDVADNADINIDNATTLHKGYYELDILRENSEENNPDKFYGSKVTLNSYKSIHGNVFLNAMRMRTALESLIRVKQKLFDW